MMLEIWFFLWALLWAGYFVLDGFDLGLGMILPLITKNEEEKRTVYNAAGPFWDGNEVWLITAGGVTFAAFPVAYAVMFSALYAPLLILLFALIFRAAALEFRRKIEDPKWYKICDITLTISSFIPSLLLGVAFANLFMGIPIDAEGVYHGTILTLLNPYGLTGGILFVLMFAMHGALWLEFKSQGILQERALRLAKSLWPIVLMVTVVFLALTFIYTNTFQNILPAFYGLLVAAVVALLAVRLLMGKVKAIFIWMCSGAFILCATLFLVIGMYPGIILSSMNPAYSITVFNGASSPLTLSIMLGIVCFTLPIVIGYQVWVYRVFSDKITPEDLSSDNAY